MTKVVAFRCRSTIEQQAAAWLIRLDGDDPLSPEERQHLKLWLAASPAHREHLSRLADLWEDMDVLTELAVPLGSDARFGPTRQSGWRDHWCSFAAAATILVASAVLLVALLVDQ